MLKLLGMAYICTLNSRFLFPYLDLVCTDTGVFSESVSNYLVEAAKTEYSLFTRNERVDRVRTRLARVEQLINYLAAEEARERELYSLKQADDELFTSRCRVAFDAERTRVLTSASRQALKPRRRR